jgi:hypothetical protein
LKPGLNVGWFGWDDRIGNGFCGTCNQEAQLAFAALVVRACTDFSRSLGHAGLTAMSANYTKTAAILTKTLRSQSAFPHAYGLHAAGNLVNAGIVTKNETEALFQRLFTEAATVCSWSPFNQYWLLQALGNMGGKMDYATASIELCWGGMTTLGEGCLWELYSPEWPKFMKRWVVEWDQNHANPPPLHRPHALKLSHTPQRGQGAHTAVILPPLGIWCVPLAQPECGRDKAVEPRLWELHGRTTPHAAEQQQRAGWHERFVRGW